MRLQIAVNYAVVMRGGQAIGKLNAHARNFWKREWTCLDLVVERLPGNQFHHQKIDAILIGRVVDRFDVGMVQLGERESFLAEFLTDGFIGQSTGRKNLQSDVAVEFFVVSAVDYAHSTGADEFDDAIVAQRIPKHCGRAPVRAY